MARRTLCAAIGAGFAALLAGGVAADPPTMKAIRQHGFGGVEVLKYEAVPRPTAGEGELLVRVRAAGVNPVDAEMIETRHTRGKIVLSVGD